MKKENVFIDLSKCSEEEQKHIFSLIGGKPDKNMSSYMGGNECLIFFDKWERHNRNNFYNRTELTYHDFIKLFEDGEDEKKCCDSPDIQWNKVEIYIGDKQGSYKDLNFKFCDNCGETFNEAFD